MRDEVLGQIVFALSLQRYVDYCQNAELADQQRSDDIYAVIVHLAQNTLLPEAAGLHLMMIGSRNSSPLKRIHSQHYSYWIKLCPRSGPLRT